MESDVIAALTGEYKIGDRVRVRDTSLPSYAPNRLAYVGPATVVVTYQNTWDYEVEFENGARLCFTFDELVPMEVGDGE